MEHLSAIAPPLVMASLAFGALQVWWIASTLRQRDLARPLSEREFRGWLERNQAVVADALSKQF